jgi:soluble lytic murein transglycosylase-like protein
MQLLPTTAADIDTPSAAAFRHRLKNPQINVDMGQRYLSSLLQRDYINNDLARTAAAYNAGPGNVYRWVRDLPHHNDTLLFLELLPAAETRAFVERVLTNFWIYRLRMGQPTPSLTALANGDAPQYISLDMANGRDG